MHDTNVYLSRWPFRRLPLDETDVLADRLRAAGIAQVWAGSFDALLHKDVAAVNRRLAAECARHADLFIPIGAVNPALPDWQEDVRRCAEVYGMRGVRLHPNYHEYALDDPRFAELLTLAATHRLVVQIAVRMEDDRTQHPLVRVPAVDLANLAAVAEAHPQVQLQLINCGRDLSPPLLRELAERPNVWVESAMTEGVGGVGQLAADFPYERLLLGTYAPFFAIESSLLKLEESELGSALRARITRGNAESLLQRARRT
jgi:predicted TIM-barrel fold metal-dependent hydrolase